MVLFFHEGNTEVSVLIKGLGGATKVISVLKLGALSFNKEEIQETKKSGIIIIVSVAASCFFMWFLRLCDDFERSSSLVIKKLVPKKTLAFRHEIGRTSQKKRINFPSLKNKGI